MSAIVVAVPALFWAGAIARAPSAARVPQRRPLCAALAAFAIALTLNVPSVYMSVDRTLRVPNIADLGEHAFGILGVFALLRALNTLSAMPGPSGRWSWALVALPVMAICASAVLFLTASLPVETANFTDRYGHLPQIAAYWSITIGYFGISLILLASLIIRHGRRTRRLALRLGLRTIGVGVGIGVAYSLMKIVELIADADGGAGPIRRVMNRIDPTVLAAGATVVGVGLLLPAVETAWTAAAARVSDRLALLRLRRLWLDLTATVPDVVLGDRPSLWADVFATDASFRLYRRIIEIRDVYLALRAGESAPSLRPRDVELLHTALATVDSASVAGPEGRAAAHQGIRRELRALLELARIWQPDRRVPTRRAIA